MIISVYIIVAEMTFPAMYNYWAILGLDIYAIIVWLSAASLGADALSGSILGDQFSTGAVPYTGGSNTFTSFPTATSSTTAATGFISLPTTTGAASNSSPTSPTSGTDPTGTQTCIYDPSTGLYDICYKKRTISLLGRATVDGISYSTTPRNALAAACGLGGLEMYVQFPSLLFGIRLTTHSSIFFIITLTFLGIYLHRHRRAGGRCSPNLPRRTVISGTYEGKDVELLQRGYYAYQEDAGEL